MAREIDLLGYWMPVLRQLKEFKEIAKAETPELKYILEQIERTLNNMFIETADEYGIKRFEDMMGIYPEAGASLETRRCKPQGAGAPAKMKNYVNADAFIFFREKVRPFQHLAKPISRTFRKDEKSNGTDKKRLV